MTFDVRVVCNLSGFFFQAEDGIRDLVRSRGLGDVYKRQIFDCGLCATTVPVDASRSISASFTCTACAAMVCSCLLYTSDAADERSSVDLGGRRIIKKKKNMHRSGARVQQTKQIT